MDLNAIADGLVTNVRTLADDGAGPLADLTALPYVPDSIPEPCFFVAEIDVTFDKTFGRGSDELEAICRLFVSRADEQYGQKRIRQFMAGSGPQSIKAGIESDRTLGGACDDLRVTRARGNRLYIVGDAGYYGVEFSVYVIGDGG